MSLPKPTFHPIVDWHFQNEDNVIFDPLQHPYIEEAGYLLKRYKPLIRRGFTSSVLGEGNYGVVHLVRDTTDPANEPIALKTLPHGTWNSSARTNARREAAIAKKLFHPNIVRIFDFIENSRSVEDWGWGIAMEYVDGRDLDKVRLRETALALGLQKDEADEGEAMPLSVERIRLWIQQICSALHYAHGEKVIHRDIKLKNILLTDPGDGSEKIYLTDFGISDLKRHTATQEIATGPSDIDPSKKTHGTLDYMPPERFFDRKANFSEDIYALGATIYELLTGKPPLHLSGLPDEEVIKRIQNEIPVRMGERIRGSKLPVPKIPENWERTVARCLKKRSSDRPRSIAEVAKLLDLELTLPTLASQAKLAAEHKKEIDQLQRELEKAENRVEELLHKKETSTQPEIVSVPIPRPSGKSGKNREANLLLQLKEAERKNHNLSEDFQRSQKEFKAIIRNLESNLSYHTKENNLLKINQQNFALKEAEIASAERSLKVQDELINHLKADLDNQKSDFQIRHSAQSYTFQATISRLQKELAESRKNLKASINDQKIKDSESRSAQDTITAYESKQEENRNSIDKLTQNLAIVRQSETSLRQENLRISSEYQRILRVKSELEAELADSRSNSGTSDSAGSLRPVSKSLKSIGSKVQAGLPLSRMKQKTLIFFRLLSPYEYFSGTCIFLLTLVLVLVAPPSSHDLVLTTQNALFLLLAIALPYSTLFVYGCKHGKSSLFFALHGIVCLSLLYRMLLKSFELLGGDSFASSRTWPSLLSVIVSILVGAAAYWSYRKKLLPPAAFKLIMATIVAVGDGSIIAVCLQGSPVISL